MLKKSINLLCYVCELKIVGIESGSSIIRKLILTLEIVAAPAKFSLWILQGSGKQQST